MFQTINPISFLIFSVWMESLIRSMYPWAPSTDHISDVQAEKFLHDATSFMDSLQPSANASYLRLRILFAKLRRMIKACQIDIPTLVAFAQALVGPFTSTKQDVSDQILYPSWSQIDAAHTKLNRKDLGTLLPTWNGTPEPVKMIRTGLRILLLDNGHGPELFSNGTDLAATVNPKIWKPILEDCMLLKSKKGEEKEWVEKYIASGRSTKMHVLLSPFTVCSSKAYKHFETIDVVYGN